MTWFRLLAATLIFASVLTGVESNGRAAADDPILIIANNSLKASSISAGEVKRLFRKELSSIGGVRVVPINAGKSSPLRATFVKKVYGISISEELSAWEKLKVMSGAQPPTEIDNTLKAVFSVKNGISYCFKSQFKPGTAKILLTL